MDAKRTWCLLLVFNMLNRSFCSKKDWDFFLTETQRFDFEIDLQKIFYVTIGNDNVDTETKYCPAQAA